MTWNKIIAAVDATPAGAAAAASAWDLASRTGGTCDLVHMTVDVSALPATVEPDVDLDLLMEHITNAARKDVETALHGAVPDAALERLDIIMGKPAWMLPREIRRRGSDLLVLGGKHHSALGRWLGGSLAHYAARTIDVPTLIVIPTTDEIRRILVPVDLSAASCAVLRSAVDLAAVYGAEVRAMYAVEPVPTTYPIQLPAPDAYRRYAEEGLAGCVQSVAGADAIERVVREGHAHNAIAEEAAAWSADLVIAGSHGKGFVDRILLGSTTQRLLYRLPTSVLIVPVGVDVPGTETNAEATAAAQPA